MPLGGDIITRHLDFAAGFLGFLGYLLFQQLRVGPAELDAQRHPAQDCRIQVLPATNRMGDDKPKNVSKAIVNQPQIYRKRVV